MLVFKTPEGGPAVELSGVGVAAADGRSAVPVADVAAQYHELQDGGKPLEGKDLRERAREWGEPRGLVVADAKEADVVGEPFRPPANEVAEEAYRLLYRTPEPPAPPATNVAVPAEAVPADDNNSKRATRKEQE